MDLLSSLSLLSQYITAILSIMFFLQTKKTFAKWLALLLIITVIVESIGAYCIITEKPVFLHHQVYILLELIIIRKMYNGLIKDKAWLKLSNFFLIAFLVIWFLILYRKNFFYTAIIIGAINIGLLVFLYLRELLLSDEILNYKKMLSFWVSVGFLVFYLPSIPFFSLVGYMKSRDLFPVLNILIIIMNIIISFGLIWSKKKEEY
ncbi:hypothetical protein H0I31_03770 [Tenacibaculum sp. AHE15PA]|uniref:hypothetical protein n=1 Tax=unclassified Tenacibaculum TaxID=2635139 RepID=UPI001C4EC932|nr:MULTISPECIES: hypothetical protein [unclassified Tenacibaculum]QXP72827.1 hypothetical protein H0I30_09030 [Tenacibaculum sp. AHE14PA]QXP76741.1 hypothetical protein H0I31_03770 [Tenacibaculum sp. AHE15PA]